MSDRHVRAFERVLELVVMLNEDMTTALAKDDLTVARATLLWELARLGPSPQQQLAKALGVSPRNITGLVDRLEAGGYVTRERHPTDRRALLVTLTARGTEWMTRQQHEQEQLARALFAPMTADRLDAFTGGLDDVLRTLRELGASTRSAMHD